MGLRREVHPRPCGAKEREWGGRISSSGMLTTEGFDDDDDDEGVRIIQPWFGDCGEIETGSLLDEDVPAGSVRVGPGICDCACAK